MAGYVACYAGTMVRVGGSLVTLAKGAAVPVDADPEHVDVLLARHMIVEGEPETGFTTEGGAVIPAPVQPVPPTEPETAGDQPPAKSASRADWDAYAKSPAGGSLTDEQIAAFTSKEELQKHYGIE